MHDVWVVCPDTTDTAIIKSFIAQIDRVVSIGSIASAISPPEKNVDYTKNSIGLHFSSAISRNEFQKNTNKYLYFDSTHASEQDLKIRFAVSARWCIERQTKDFLQQLSLKHKQVATWLSIIEAKEILFDSVFSGKPWKYAEQQEKDISFPSVTNFPVERSPQEVTVVKENVVKDLPRHVVKVNSMEAGNLYELSEEQQEKIREHCTMIQKNGCIRKFLYENGIHIVTRDRFLPEINHMCTAQFHFFTTDINTTIELIGQLGLIYMESPLPDSIVIYNNVPKKIDIVMNRYYMRNGGLRLFTFEKKVPETSAFPIGDKIKTKIVSQHMRS